MHAKQFKKLVLSLFNSWASSSKNDEELLKRIISLRDRHPEQDWEALGLGQHKADIAAGELKLPMSDTGHRGAYNSMRA